ncbi:MAG TPA: hypothetical protein VF765_05095 [Polyangiaceae bacterium]
MELKADSVRDALEQRYRETGEWDELVDLYFGRIEVVDDAEKVELFKRLADVLWEELGDAAAARDALVEAIALDPSDDEAADRLEDIAGARDGGWTALVDAISAKVLVVTSGITKAKLAERVVRWARGPMNDAPTADRFLAQMRNFDPAHPLVHERLASAYADVGNWDAQRESLERALARTENAIDRANIHVQLGVLYENHLGQPRHAAVHYEQALAVTPRCMIALSGLERIARLAENYPRLREILDRQVDAADDDQERIGALVRLAELLEQHFVRPRESVPKYQLALELDAENPRALDGIERCWHALREWDKLAAALERRAVASDDPRESIAILRRLAEVRESKQEDIDAAMFAWRRVYELDTAHDQAIHELARLCEKQGDVTAAAAYRARLADLTDNAKEKARIHVSVGEMLAPSERDPACARIHFERAVEMDPRNGSAWENLQKLAERERDMMYATFCLERRAEHADSARVKAHLLVELARMRLSLGDNRGALATFEYAFTTDATNETAARSVIEDWVKREKWSDAQRACDVLVAAATRDRDDRALLKLLRLSTRIALALGYAERSLVAAQAALELAPRDKGARDDVLHVCHELRGIDTVRARLRTLAERVGRDAMELDVGALVRLGEVRVAAGDANGGIEMLCLALTREPKHLGGLAALANVFVDRRDWGRAANCKHRLARATEDAGDRKAYFLEAADIWEKRAKQPHRAAIVLDEALRRGVRDESVLYRLVALWNALGEWEDMIGALRGLGDLENDPVRRAKHVYAGAGIVRDKLRDVRRAARLYEESLDLDPSRLEAFERVVRIWTASHDWRELAQSYRRMIGRVQNGTDSTLEHALWHQLGLVYRDRLGDLPHALDAFRRASKVAPNDEEDRRIIVELLVLTGQTELAIADMRGSLDRDATRPSTYRELYELHLRESAHDRAWLAASALVHLQEADEQQAHFVADFPALDLGDVPGTLASCAWESHIMAPGMDGRLTAVFRNFVPAIVRARMARVPEKSRLKWLGTQVRESDSSLAAYVVRMVRDGAEILGVPAPLLLSRPKLTVPFAVAATPTPALFVSLQACETLPPELLRFLVVRRLAELRPELLAHALFPTLSELKTLLKTALRVAVTRLGAPGQSEDDACIMRAMQSHELEGLRDAVSSVVGTEARADIRRWHQDADLTTSRAALLLTGDIELAWRAIQREPRSPADLAPSDWRSEMLRFLVSDEHAELRDAIGICVEARCQR